MRIIIFCLLLMQLDLHSQNIVMGTSVQGISHFENGLELNIGKEFKKHYSQVNLIYAKSETPRYKLYTLS
jgi:hypothetical protein